MAWTASCNTTLLQNPLWAAQPLQSLNTTCNPPHDSSTETKHNNLCSRTCLKYEELPANHRRFHEAYVSVNDYHVYVLDVAILLAIPLHLSTKLLLHAQSMVRNTC